MKIQSIIYLSYIIGEFSYINSVNDVCNYTIKIKSNVKQVVDARL